MSTHAYQDALDAIEQMIAGATGSDEILRQAVDLLHDRFDSYSWVGIYVVEGDELQLGPWKGPHATEHVRIPVGSGVCGAAAASGQTEVVDDVTPITATWPASPPPAPRSSCR